MFKHEKMLFHPVEVERPNPQYAVLLQEQLGGGNGELKAALQYMSQSFRIKDPKIKDVVYWCMCDEIGQEGTPHTHLYVVFPNAVIGGVLPMAFPATLAVRDALTMLVQIVNLPTLRTPLPILPDGPHGEHNMGVRGKFSLK